MHTQEELNKIWNEMMTNIEIMSYMGIDEKRSYCLGYLHSLLTHEFIDDNDIVILLSELTMTSF